MVRETIRELELRKHEGKTVCENTSCFLLMGNDEILIWYRYGKYDKMI